jgi:ferredoxin
VLTEVISQDRHYFTAGLGSESGEELLKELGFREATAYEIEEAEKVLSDAPSKFTKRVDLTDVVEILQSNYENPLWEKIAERCLSCGNCTMVCPTCFCHNVEDVTDLTGQVAKRVRRWDSYFTVEFSYIFREGEEANEFYIIRNGKVSPEIISPGKEPIIIQTLESGEVLGWSWLVPP